MLIKIQHLLVCTDLSEKSDEVLIQAEVLRTRVNATADILYVSDVGPHLLDLVSPQEKGTYKNKFLLELKQELQEKFNAQIKRTGIQARMIFSEGEVLHEIQKKLISPESPYDLLIVGHNSKMGKFPFYLGSIARKLVASADTPVLVIKRELQFKKLAGFINGLRPMDWVVMTSFEYYRLLKFEKIEFISLRTDLHPLGGDPDEEIMFKQQLEEEMVYLSRKDDHYELRIEPSTEVYLARHFARIIDEDQIDLAILKRHRGKKLHQKIIGSETLRLLEIDTCSILVFPV